jgi:hypothetical protein
MNHEMVDLITINQKEKRAEMLQQPNSKVILTTYETKKKTQSRDNLMVKFMVSSWHGEM